MKIKDIMESPVNIGWVNINMPANKRIHGKSAQIIRKLPDGKIHVRLADPEREKSVINLNLVQGQYEEIKQDSSSAAAWVKGSVKSNLTKRDVGV